MRPELRTSSHLFFRLSDPAIVAFLRDWTRAPAPGQSLQPEVLNKIHEWLGGDGSPDKLTDWDISRDPPYFGIPIPDEPGKYFYVWLDAPIGYLASLKSYFDSGKAKAKGETRSFAEFLPATDTEQYHFIGKDIVYFHTLFWPAMLKFAGAPYRTPTNVFVHGFLTALGEKMSKSRGTGISPDFYLDLGLDPEWLRYYIAAKLNDKVEDIDFNPDDFVARVNSDLVGKYVNIASRAATFIARHFDGKLSPRSPMPGPRTRGRLDECRRGAREASRRPTTRASSARPCARSCASPTGSNERFDQAKPWELAKDPARRDELQDVCTDALNAFRVLTYYLTPVLPGAGARVAGPVRHCRRHFAGPTSQPRPRTSIQPYAHLMTRIDPKQIDALLEGPAPANAPPPPSAASRARADASAAGSRSRSTISPRSTCASRGSSTPSTSTARTSC